MSMAKKSLLVLFTALALLMLGFFFVRFGKYQGFFVINDAQSMKEYPRNARLLFSKEEMKLPLGRGTIVAYTLPAKEKYFYLGEVVAIGGDMLAIHEQSLYVNGQLIPNSYMGNQASIGPKHSMQLVVAHDEVLVLPTHEAFRPLHIFTGTIHLSSIKGVFVRCLQNCK